MKNETKNNDKLIITIGTIIIVIILIIMSLVIYINMNPSKIFIKGMNEIKETYFDFVEKEIEDSKTTFTLKTNLKSSDKDINELFQFINKFYIENSIYQNISDKIIHYDILGKYNNENILSASAFIYKDELYGYSKEIYDKYVMLDYVDMDVFDEYKEIQNELKKYNEIIEMAYEELNNSLKNEYFITQKRTLKNNDKDEKFVANKLILSKDNIKNILCDTIEALTNNNKFLVEFSKLSGIDVEDVKAELLQLVVELDEEISDYNEFVLTIEYYTKGLLNSFAGVGINFKTDYSNDMVYILKNKKVISLYYKNAQETDKILSVKIDKDKYYFDIEEFEFEDIKYDLDFEMTYKNEGNYKYNKIDVSKAVKMDDMEYEEIEKIQNNILENKVINKILEDFEKLSIFGSDYDDFEDINGNINNHEHIEENIVSAAELYAANNPDIFMDSDQITIYVYELIDENYIDADLDYNEGICKEEFNENVINGCIKDPNDKNNILNNYQILITKKAVGAQAQIIKNKPM